MQQMYLRHIFIQIVCKFFTTLSMKDMKNANTLDVELIYSRETYIFIYKMKKMSFFVCDCDLNRFCRHMDGSLIVL